MVKIKKYIFLMFLFAFISQKVFAMAGTDYNNIISTYPATYVSGNVKWIVDRGTYKYKGKNYNIDTFIAEPVSYKSNLVTTGYFTGKTEFLYVYSYRIETVVSFKYVSDNSNKSPVLSYVSTKSTVYTDYQYKNLESTDSEGISPVTSGSKKMYFTSDGYNSNIYAIKGYTDLVPARSYVDKIKIVDLKSKIDSYIYPVCPFYPGQIY